MKAAAMEKLAELDNQIAVFQPSTLIPFAVYVWFCRDDNFYMNKNVNTIADIALRYDDRIETVVLYQGDVYEVGSAWDSTASISRYEQDRLRHTRPVEVKEQSIPIETLIGLPEAENRKLKSNNALWLLQPLRWGGTCSRSRSYCGTSRKACDIRCSAASNIDQFRATRVTSNAVRQVSPR